MILIALLLMPVQDGIAVPLEWKYNHGNRVISQREKPMEIILGLLGLGGIAALLMPKAPLPSETDYKKALEKLRINPNDPDANTVVGKYLAFVQGNYDDGLAYLSKSGDKTLRNLAEHEKDPNYVISSPQKVGMGDEWITASRSLPVLHKIFNDRAIYWYGSAWQDLKSEPLWGDKLRERLRKLYLAGPNVPAPKNLMCPSGWKCPIPDAKAGRSNSTSKNGQFSFAVSGWKSPLPSYSVIDQSVDVRPGRYTFSAWALSDGTEKQDGFTIYVQDSDGANIILNPLPVLPDQPWWKKLEVEVEVPKNGVKAGIGFGMSSKQGMVYIDDLSIKGADGKELLKNWDFESK